MTRGIRLGLAAALVGGCQALTPGRVGDPPPATLTLAAPEATQEAQLRFRVDPLHGAAFPVDEESAALAAWVEPQEVSHSLREGRTSVRVQLTHVGGAPVSVSPVCVSERRLVASELPARWPRLAPGEVRQAELTFDNPTGDGFEFSLTLALAPPEGPPPQPFALAQVAGGVATASSSYGALLPDRAIDGDAATQWACAEWRPAAAWLAVDVGAPRVMDAVTVKLRPFTGGATFRVETSSDGVTWTPATGPLRNTSWFAERKPLLAPVTARHVRLAFTNDAVTPEGRFSVFSLAVEPSSPGASPTPTASVAPTSPPSMTPSPTPTPSGASSPWLRHFDADALGSDPGDFVDPRAEGFSYDWMPAVRWRVVDHAGSRQYLHDGLANLAYLSFRRYRGTAFGTSDGLLPARYFTELDVTPLRSYTYSPTGDQGTQVYYLDPVNYLEVLIKPTWYEVWAATNAAPFQSRGWARLFATPVATSAGQKRRLGAEVDCTTGRTRVFLDGVSLATLSVPMLTQRPHWLALRGAGNIVAHDNVRVEPR
ncbi:MAG: discoidin domain-containing protein [Candidatus Sericytochromatia bacterium]|nr:discoidin domain-containing protein [Candidatus Sericytochromatia bacterium]